MYGFESSFGESKRLAKGKEFSRAARCLVVVVRAGGEVARRLQKDSNAGRHVLDLITVPLGKRTRNTSAEGGAACRRQRIVERVLIEHMDKLVVQREGTIGEFVFRSASNEYMDLFQNVKAVFDIRRVHFDGLSDDGGIKLRALHACSEEKLQIALFHLVDFALNHAAH